MRRLLIDLGSVAYKNDRAVDLTTPRGERCGAIFGSLRSIRFEASNYDPDVIVCACDRGSRVRRELYPEYKANRRKNITPKEQLRYEEYLVQVGILEHILDTLPVSRIAIGGVEADDIVGVLSMDDRHEDVIITGDKDLLQLVSRTTKVHYTHHQITYGVRNLRKKTGLGPRQQLYYKVLVGDPSDNIQGVMGIGKKTAPTLLAKYEYLFRLFADLRRSGAKKFGRMTLEEAEQRIARNLQLMIPGLVLSQREVRYITRNWAKSGTKKRWIPLLRERFFELGFSSFLEGNMSWFLEPFYELERRHEARSKEIR